MELWIESFDAFCISTNVLMEAWSAYYSHTPYHSTENQHSPYKEVSGELNKLFTTIQRQVQPAVHETFTNRCLKPVVGILSIVPDLNEQLQQRKNFLADFDNYKSKIQKEHAAGRDNNHPNVVKKAAKLDESAKRLHELQTSINQVFEEFENARTQTLGPELASFLACCHTYSAAVHNSTSRLLPLLPQSVSSLAALDYSNISSELKLERFDIPTVKHDKQKAVPPVYERVDSMGGKLGGYGSSQTFPNPVVFDSETKKHRNSAHRNSTEAPAQRSASKKLEDKEKRESTATAQHQQHQHHDQIDEKRKSTNSVRFADRILPPPPPTVLHPNETHRNSGSSESHADEKDRISSIDSPIVSMNLSHQLDSSTNHQRESQTVSPPPKPPKPPKPPRNQSSVATPVSENERVHVSEES